MTPLRCDYLLPIELRLQQQQRLANREKEHAVQQIQLERDELEQQLHHCQQQVRSLQADRSLLIVCFVHMHPCTDTHMHTQISTLIRVHIHTYMHMYPHTCTYIHTHATCAHNMNTQISSSSRTLTHSISAYLHEIVAINRVQAIVQIQSSK